MNEEFRNVFPIEKIILNDEVKNFLIKFSNKNVYEYLKILREAIDDADYSYKSLENNKYILRIRFIEDKHGYSLAPHQDSNDTVLSFIIQLDENNSNTTFYKLKKIYKLKIEDNLKVANKIEMLNKILLNAGHKKLKWGSFQFNEIPTVFADEIFAYNFIEQKNSISIYKFDEEKCDDFGDIYAIHNIQQSLITGNKYKAINDFSFHGVKPIKEKSRKLIILDLIGQNTNDYYLKLKGIGNDKYTYFVIYDENGSNKINNILN